MGELKKMKSKLPAILLGVACLHAFAISAVWMSGGCRSPEVLQERTNIPPPAIEPGKAPVPPPAVIEEEIIVTPAPVVVPTPPPAVKTDKSTATALTYTVQKNDSFWKIARIYGVSLGELASENNMPLDKPLKVGTVLKIPPGGSLIPADKLPPIKSIGKKPAKADSAPSKPSKSAKAELPSDGVYVVKSGDSLWKIAHKYGLGANELAKMNHLDPAKQLQLGQKIIVRSGAQAPASAKKSDTAKAAAKATQTALPVEKTSTKVSETIESVTEKSIDSDSELDKIIGSTAQPAPVTQKETLTETVTETVTTTLPAAESSDKFISHEYLEGETLESIAKFYGVKKEDILKANPTIAPDSKIAPYTKLKIPGY